MKSSTDPQTKRLVATIEKMKWWDACDSWGKASRAHKDIKRAELLRAFLTSDNTLTGFDMGHAGDRSVAIGMTECGVWAALGKPTSVNQTETASGSSAQYVYREKNVYVYVHQVSRSNNRVVRSIQH